MSDIACFLPAPASSWRRRGEPIRPRSPACSPTSPKGSRFELAGLAHFNHSIRGRASEEDEHFCRNLAERLDVGFVAERGDVPAAARKLKASIEDAARQMRYAFLDRARRQSSATHVALGHTRDDQAETLLLNLLRGAGTRGLGGMPRSREAFVRPLLDCSHEELVEWLRERGTAYREDESNRDRRYSRNRLRHDVMPALERAFPGAAAALARAAGLARSDADYLERLAEGALDGASRLDSDGGLVIDAPALAGMPLALARGAVRLAVQRVAGDGFVTAEQTERLVDLVANATGGRLMLPGLQADLAGGQLLLRPRRGRSAAASGDDLPTSSGNSFRATLSIPGEVLLGDGRVVSSELRLEPIGRAAIARLSGPTTAVLDASGCSSLSVRYWRSGDWFRPLGLRGRKKLQDFFVDRKVPRDARAGVPLVVDGDDRIVWVAGHAVSEDFRVSDVTRAVVILKLRGERV